MVQLIMGLKGSGKTKRLVEMVATAVREESGSVVCIEKDKKLTYDIPYQARLIYACDYAYALGSYDFFKGFLSGLHAGNYDITHVFVDNFTKMLTEVSEQQIAEFLAWLNDFSEREHIQFTLSLSMDPATTGSEITCFFPSRCIIFCVAMHNYFRRDAPNLPSRRINCPLVKHH